MQELRDLARKLLADGTVKVVIGYEQGPRGARPVFVSDPADADRLIFDHHCVQSLATYLSPRRTHVAALGKPAVVVKGCDLRAVAGMIRESQLKRENVALIGVRCGGVTGEPASETKLTAETVAPRCNGCEAREPASADYLVGAALPAPPASNLRAKRIAEIEAMTPEQRLAFWTSELERCLRCNACREVCPMCFCLRCLADKTVPQWIESSAHARGNLAWQVARVMHHAGRCIDCGECERACPAEIPLGLLNSKIAQIVFKRYGFAPSDDPGQPAPIGAYRLDDAQEFII